MTRDLLFQQLMSGFHDSNIPLITSLICEYNELAKTFTGIQLREIDSIMAVANLNPNSDIFHYFIESNLYKRGSGACCFINELLFATQIGENISRYYMPHKAGTSAGFVGFPDCIDLNHVTNELQGWQLKNHTGRQPLPNLALNSLKYDIITKPENFGYYYWQYPESRLRCYSDFSHTNPLAYSSFPKPSQDTLRFMEQFKLKNAIHFSRFIFK